MILIGGIDYTDELDYDSIDILEKKTTMNDLQCVLYSDVALPIFAGHEVEFFIDSVIRFGGVVQTIVGSHSSNYVRYTVTATSYEQITDRRTIQVDYNGVTCGSIATAMVGILASEGITAGTIDAGATISYTKNAVSVREVLDEIATASGYVWYINNDKELFFQEDYIYTDGVALPNDYALTNSNQTLKSYYNKIFVLGAKDEDGAQIVGSASDTVEQTRMSGLFGSGVYGTIIRSSSTVSDVEANTLATQELKRRSYERDGIMVQSRQALNVGDYYLGLTVPEAFISNQDYVIDEVRIIGNKGTPIYMGKLVAYSTAVIVYDERWQEKFKQFQNVNNESTAISSSVILTQRIVTSEDVIIPTLTVVDSATVGTQAPSPVNPTENVTIPTVTVTDSVTVTLT